VVVRQRESCIEFARTHPAQNVAQHSYLHLVSSDKKNPRRTSIWPLSPNVGVSNRVKHSLEVIKVFEVYKNAELSNKPGLGKSRVNERDCAVSGCGVRPHLTRLLPSPD